MNTAFQQWMMMYLGWFQRYLHTDTQWVQAGMWLLAALAMLFAVWEMLRRQTSVLDRAVLISLPGGKVPAGSRHEVNGHDLVIGRGETVDVNIPDRHVALQHASVGHEETGFWVYDLGSREGVEVNGRPIQRRARLRDGDLLDIAGTPFRFECRQRAAGRPELLGWLLLLASTVFFVFVQYAVWKVAGNGKPSEAALLNWALGLGAGAWLASLAIKRRWPRADLMLLPLALAITGLGLAVVMRVQPSFYTRQAIAVALGLAALTGIAVSDIRALARYRYVSLAGAIALLGFTVFLGSDINGQRLAVNVLGFQFQPSEPAKLLLALFLAGLLSERQEMVARTGRSFALTRADFRYLGPVAVAWALALGLLVVQKDLGAALLFFGLFVAFVGLASGRAIFLFLSLVAFASAVGLASVAFGRVQQRIDLWLDPWQDPKGLGYQLVQGLFALSAGGINGLGLGNGFPRLIPAAHTDLPLAVIGEELGLIGTLGLLALFGVLILRGYRTARRADDDFLGLLAGGLTAVLALQGVVIMGGVLRVLPLTGVTLPFISFGGTSMVTNLALIGLLIAASATADRPMLATEPSAAREGSVTSRYSWKRQVSWMSAASLAAFGVLGAFLFHWQVLKSREFAAHANNPRLLILEPRLNRGQILTADGQVVAKSVLEGDRYQRVYPTGALMSGVLGYSSMRHGKTGVEGAGNLDLLGAYTQDSIAAALRRAQTGKPGDNVRLTIDKRLQLVADKALGSRRGTVVAIDPKTGGILAMVSHPSYALPQDIDAHWEEIIKDKRQPLLFRATHGVYPPGSTFKVVTSAVALDGGVVNASTPFSCTGAARIGQYTWHCFRGHVHGGINFAQALQLSCNVAYGQVGYKLGRDRLVAGAKKMGIGEAAPMEITTSRGLLDPQNVPWRSIPVQLGFGQGPLAVTPLQMALVASAVANDGVLMQPHLIQQYEHPDGKVYRRTKPKVWKRAMTAQTARTVQAMMESVVAAGTGVAAQVEGVRIGGKTGTAENPHGTDHAWFISFAPVGDPKIAMAILVEGGGQGGRAAAPIAKQMIEARLGKK